MNKTWDYEFIRNSNNEIISNKIKMIVNRQNSNVFASSIIIELEKEIIIFDVDLIDFKLIPNLREKDKILFISHLHPDHFAGVKRLNPDSIILLKNRNIDSIQKNYKVFLNDILGEEFTKILLRFRIDKRGEKDNSLIKQNIKHISQFKEKTQFIFRRKFQWKNEGIKIKAFKLQGHSNSGAGFIIEENGLKILIIDDVFPINIKCVRYSTASNDYSLKKVFL